MEVVSPAANNTTATHVESTTHSISRMVSSAFSSSSTTSSEIRSYLSFRFSSLSSLTDAAGGAGLFNRRFSPCTLRRTAGHRCDMRGSKASSVRLTEPIAVVMRPARYRRVFRGLYRLADLRRVGLTVLDRRQESSLPGNMRTRLCDGDNSIRDHPPRPTDRPRACCTNEPRVDRPHSNLDDRGHYGRNKINTAMLRWRWTKRVVGGKNKTRK